MRHVDYQRFQRHGWRGRVRSDWRNHLMERNPPGRLIHAPGETIRDRPSARTRRLKVGGVVVFVKHLIAPKDGRRIGPLVWLKWRLGPSAAVRVLRISRRLRSHGFRTPPVLLAARRSRSLRAEELLVTEAVEGTGVWTVVREQADAAGRASVLRMVGRRIAALHAARFIHGDLLPGNLMLDPDRRDLIFFDNDRTRRWPFPPPAYIRRRNLVQIVYLLPWRFRWSTIRSLLDGYLDASDCTGSARRLWLARVLRRAHRRHVAVRPRWERHWIRRWGGTTRSPGIPKRL